MKRSRASVGAALTYWVGNPLLNPATIVFTAFVLSWQWALLRLVGGVALVAVIAAIGLRMGGREQTSVLGADHAPNRVVRPSGRLPLHRVMVEWFATSAKFALMIIPEWFVIVLALGAARAWLFPMFGPGLSFGIIALLILAITGMLFVIPTAGEIPVVQSLLAYGVAPGLAGTLLLTLPAVSLPSIIITRRVFPSRLLALTMLTVVAGGIVTGVIAQALL